MRWVILFALLSVPGVALAQATPPAGTSRFDELLARARASRAAFQKRTAPTPRGNPKDFAQTELARWFRDTKGLHDDAASRYARALEAAAVPAQRVTVLAEAGEMSLLLAERTYRAGERSMPRNIAKSPELRVVFLSALDDATNPLRHAASEALTRCATLAEAHQVASAEAKRCRALVANPSRIEPKRRATAADVERGVRQARAKIRRCYESALATEPALSGDLKLAISVAPDGSVGQVKLSGSLANHAVGSCVAGVIKALPLPRPAKGAKLTVSYPLVFDPARN